MSWDVWAFPLRRIISRPPRLGPLARPRALAPSQGFNPSVISRFYFHLPFVFVVFLFAFWRKLVLVRLDIISGRNKERNSRRCTWHVAARWVNSSFQASSCGARDCQAAPVPRALFFPLDLVRGSQVGRRGHGGVMGRVVVLSRRGRGSRVSAPRQITCNATPVCHISLPRPISSPLSLFSRFEVVASSRFPHCVLSVLARACRTLAETHTHVKPLKTHSQ